MYTCLFERDSRKGERGGGGVMKKEGCVCVCVCVQERIHEFFLRGGVLFLPNS